MINSSQGSKAPTNQRPPTSLPHGDEAALNNETGKTTEGALPSFEPSIKAAPVFVRALRAMAMGFIHFYFANVRVGRYHMPFRVMYPDSSKLITGTLELSSGTLEKAKLEKEDSSKEPSLK